MLKRGYKNTNHYCLYYALELPHDQCEEYILQGDNIKRNIYLKPPKEYDEGKLWKLKKKLIWLV